MPIRDYQPYMDVRSADLDDWQAKIHSMLRPGLLGDADLMEPNLNVPGDSVGFSEIPSGEAIYSDYTYLSELKSQNHTFTSEATGTYKVYIDSYYNETGNPYYQAEIKVTTGSVDEDRYLVICTVDWDLPTTTLSNLVDLREGKFGHIWRYADKSLLHRQIASGVIHDQRRNVPELARLLDVPYIDDRPKIFEADTGENYCRALCFDGTYMYMGLYTTPGKIIKIDPATMTQVGSTLTLNTGEDYITALIGGIGVNPNLYAVCHTNPFVLVAIQAGGTGDMIRLGSFTGDSGNNERNANAIAYDGTYLYVGMGHAVPFRIVKIDPGTMAQMGSTLNGTSPEDGCLSLVFDGEYLYAGLDEDLSTDPWRVVKIDISGTSPTKISTMSFDDNYNKVADLAFNGTSIFGILNTGPPRIIEINPNGDETDMIYCGYLDLNSDDGEEGHALVFDGLHIHAAVYSGTRAFICRVLGNRAQIDAWANQLAVPKALCFDGRYIYAGFDSSPAKLLQKLPI